VDSFEAARSARFFEAMRSAQTFDAMRTAQSGRDAIILKFAAPQNANEARGEKRADRTNVAAELQPDDKIPQRFTRRSRSQRRE
jgi:hypothetical protein